ncbi:MFS transporter [Phototrophicus methaneseepsis]|uniref:MFS transporter n=1 Tax=Phototrophicus methaneseepsis TaxID=2710758 RepID=A0A7S8E929_9CHLR|nr:MFS transporter [Phototrophicus methaneseepsis]QPC82626.1 MFS transporter [Phototrophicus methaneseepsis]
MNKNIATFYTLTITQILSLIGSSMTSLAFGIWLFTETGDSTPVLLASFFVMLPQALIGSFGGVIADRWPRRMVMFLSDTGQAAGTIFLLISFLSGSFQLWHLYAVAFIQGLLGMLQRPAMDASITLMVPDAHRDRANTLRQMSGPIAGIIAPVLTGFFYAIVGIVGIIFIDLATFMIAIVALWYVHIPEPPEHVSSGASQKAKPTFLQDAKVAFEFLWQTRVLLWLMVYAAALNFFLAGCINLATPYIMTLTGSEELLGILLGIMNLGMVAGGIVMFIWGGTRPRIHGIMGGLLFRAFWLMVYGIARTPFTLGLALFFLLSTNALVDGSVMSMMQLKVPPHLQGRVFALMFQMMFIATPLSLLVTGFAVDTIFEPAVGTPMWGFVAPLVGSEAGAGMGLFILLNGLCIFVLTLFVYLLPQIRHSEATIPDYVLQTNV